MRTPGTPASGPGCPRRSVVGCDVERDTPGRADEDGRPGNLYRLVCICGHVHASPLLTLTEALDPERWDTWSCDACDAEPWDAQGHSNYRLEAVLQW